LAFEGSSFMSTTNGSIKNSAVMKAMDYIGDVRRMDVNDIVDETTEIVDDTFGNVGGAYSEHNPNTCKPKELFHSAGNQWTASFY
jgi:hypothetical protein